MCFSFVYYGFILLKIYVKRMSATALMLPTVAAGPRNVVSVAFARPVMFSLNSAVPAASCW